MFKGKKMENTAGAVNLPRPNQTVINHAPSEAGRILALALVALIGAVIAWEFVLYLVESLGYRNPVRIVALSIFSSGGLLFLSLAVYIGITRTLAKYWDYRIAVAQIEAETAKSLAIRAAQPRPGESRLTEEDKRLCALLRVVMQEAYAHATLYGRNETKPWSRRANSGRIIPGITKPITEKEASVGDWLRKREVLTQDDQINRDKYPTFAHFEALLEAEFYTPIQVSKALSPVISRKGFEFINE